MKLRTVIDVDEDAIVTHLLADVQGRLHGPEFSSGEVVVFNGEAMDLGPDEPEDAWRPDVPAAGVIGVIGSYEARLHDDGRPGAYSVFFVTPFGDTDRCQITPNQVHRRREMEASDARA